MQGKTRWAAAIIVIGLLGVVIWVAGAGPGWLGSTWRPALSPIPGQSQTPAPSPSPPSDRYVSTKGVVLKITSPAQDSPVAGPLTVLGQVPGSWSFEGQFPVVLKDQSGNVLAQASAKLSGEWMTDQLVPFSASVPFEPPAGNQTGTLELQNANPSGLADKADSVSLPVRFP